MSFEIPEHLIKVIFWWPFSIFIVFSCFDNGLYLMIVNFLCNISILKSVINFSEISIPWFTKWWSFTVLFFMSPIILLFFIFLFGFLFSFFSSDFLSSFFSSFFSS